MRRAATHLKAELWRAAQRRRRRGARAGGLACRAHGRSGSLAGIGALDQAADARGAATAAATGVDRPAYPRRARRWCRRGERPGEVRGGVKQEFDRAQERALAESGARRSEFAAVPDKHTSPPPNKLPSRILETPSTCPFPSPPPPLIPSPPPPLLHPPPFLSSSFPSSPPLLSPMTSAGWILNSPIRHKKPGSSRVSIGVAQLADALDC